MYSKWVNILLCILLSSGYCLANNDVETFLENFENNKNHTVLTGHIDSLTIIRGNAEFYLGKGELTLFDFGWDKPSALVFDGNVRFKYIPPNEIERYQLHKFTGKDMLEGEFEDIAIFYTVELTNFPDTLMFTRKKANKKTWWKMQTARKTAFAHFHKFIQNRLLIDITSEKQGIFFWADFKLKKYDHYIFCEDLSYDDQYRLFRLRADFRGKYADTYSGYSDDYRLVSERNVLPIDITHYVINTVIDRGGKMSINCRVHFKTLIDNEKFLYFRWTDKNEIKSVMDSNNDTLKSIYNDDEYGFGLLLNKPISLGRDDYIEISFESKTMIKAWGTYFIRGQTFWYPRNIIRDKATYEITYDCSEDFTVISCGNLLESKKEDGRLFTKWSLVDPVSYISFNIGLFDKKDFLRENMPPVYFYYSKELLNEGQLERSGFDIASALSFFSKLFGPCPFDNINVTEIPFFHGQGSPGLIHLTWASIYTNISVTKGTFEQFRAHEVAHQWWGHIVNYESYRDIWITEGLAEFCGLIFYHDHFDDIDAYENILWNWKRNIIGGGDADSEGSKAGPVVLGRRLNSFKSDDYGVLVYTKGAYIFHMLRYLLHDFSTDSDEKFITLLRDIIDKYRDRPITTRGLQEIIEEHVQADMDWFFNQWVYGIHIPKYTFSYTTKQTPDNKYQVTCHLKQEDVPDDFQMPVPITVYFTNDKFTNLRIWVDKPEQDIDLPLLPMKPEKIVFNTNDAVLCKVNSK